MFVACWSGHDNTFAAVVSSALVYLNLGLANPGVYEVVFLVKVLQVIGQLLNGELTYTQTENERVLFQLITLSSF